MRITLMSFCRERMRKETENYAANPDIEVWNVGGRSCSQRKFTGIDRCEFLEQQGKDSGRDHLEQGRFRDHAGKRWTGIGRRVRPDTGK